MGMKNSHVMGIVQPVALWIGDEEPGENQTLMSSVILIQLKKLFLAVLSHSNLKNFVTRLVERLKTQLGTNKEMFIPVKCPHWLSIFIAIHW